MKRYKEYTRQCKFYKETGIDAGICTIGCNYENVRKNDYCPFPVFPDSLNEPTQEDCHCSSVYKYR